MALSNLYTVITLDAIYSIVQNKDTWCTRAYARNVHGVSCDPVSLQAFSFCLEGAVMKVFDDGLGRGLGSAQPFLKWLNNECKARRNNLSLSELNDIKGHESVLLFLQELLREYDGSESIF